MAPGLDIIIPVYNEGKNILTTLESLRQNVKTPFRVLICYDSDEDNTLQAIRTYSSPPFPILLVKNRGKGASGAVLTGFEASSLPAALVFPADDHHNAGIIDRMHEHFERGSDVVVASRFMPGGCMKGAGWLKSTLVRVAAFFLYYVARIPSHDPTNGFRLFSRRVIDDITIESTMGFAYSIELLVKCHRLGWKVTEVPAAWFQRAHGQSRFRIMAWVPQYLVWFFYAFATTYLRRGPGTVSLRTEKNRGKRAA